MVMVAPPLIALQLSLEVRATTITTTTATTTTATTTATAATAAAAAATAAAATTLRTGEPGRQSHCLRRRGLGLRGGVLGLAHGLG